MRIDNSYLSEKKYYLIDHISYARVSLIPIKRLRVPKNSKGWVVIVL